MRRATTPTHTFTFPETVEVGSVLEVLISYSQGGQTVLQKNLSNLTMDTESNSFSVKLTQDETKLFAPGKAVIQLRAKKGTAVLASQMMWLPVKPVINSEEI